MDIAVLTYLVLLYFFVFRWIRTLTFLVRMITYKYWKHWLKQEMGPHAKISDYWKKKKRPLLLSGCKILHDSLNLFWKPTEARNKYISSYIDGAIGRASWKPALERLQLPIEHTVPDTGPLSPTLGSSLPSQPPSTEENTILGYMPHRDDFERVSLIV